MNIATTTLLLILVIAPVEAGVRRQPDSGAVSDPPRGQVRWADGVQLAEFQSTETTAALVLAGPRKPAVQIRTINEVYDALAILADKRLDFSWPALLAWSGNDLKKLRDRAVSRSESDWAPENPRGRLTGRNGSAFGGRPWQSFSDYVRQLDDSGYHVKALAAVTERLDHLKASTANNFERSVLSSMLASWEFDRGNTANAVTILESALHDPWLTAESKLNLTVALASVLARDGRWSEANLLVDGAWKVFGKLPVAGNYAGAVERFGWIKACALKGLGQAEEANRIVSSIRREHYWPQRAAVVSRARIQAFLCMKDAQALSDELATQLEEAAPADDIFVEIQPEVYDRQPDALLMAEAIKKPRLASVIAVRARLLGSAYIEALSGWRRS